MLTIYFAEDDAAIRESIIRNVKWEEHGLKLAGQAPDGEVAYNEMKALPPDILITDLKMPFMDGMQLCRLVRKEMPETKIIILTGFGDFESVHEALNMGVAKYLLKPITPVTLTDAIAEVIEMINMEREVRSKRDDYAIELNYRPVLKAQEYIKNHYADENISLVTVAKHVNLSSAHFSTTFTRESGKTFVEFLTETRIERAKELLRNSSKRSSEIAYEVGYSDSHYFSFVFKKLTGHTPREYRAENRIQE